MKVSCVAEIRIKKLINCTKLYRSIDYYTISEFRMHAISQCLRILTRERMKISFIQHGSYEVSERLKQSQISLRNIIFTFYTLHPIVGSKGSLVVASVMAASSSNSLGFIHGSAWFQKKINLQPVSRGCHLITDELVNQIPELARFSVGVFHLQIMHTSASLALNENWDPDVRKDMEMFLTNLVPETTPFRHSCEGPDDMPAHIKSCFLGSSLTIPVTNGQLNLGTWQGIWLCEHRNRAGSRKVIVTINGALKDNIQPKQEL